MHNIILIMQDTSLNATKIEYAFKNDNNEVPMFMI